MKAPSLQRTAAVSAALHLTILILIMFFMKQPDIAMPSPYVVSLVSPLPRTGETAQPEAAAESRAVQESFSVRERESETRIEDRISELEAKKKLERIVRLRSIVSLKGRPEKNMQKPPSQASGPASSNAAGSVTYTDRIMNEIRREWVYPDTGEKNPEAVISVRIMKDGTISVKGIEKSSGNVLFDRSALRALAKASPVTPPPFEMELDIRFYP